MASEIESPPEVADTGKIDAPPVRRIVLLPDARFFVRSVSISANATAAEAASQVELALETLSPFPVAQLYHGHFWKPGLTQALVFAAFRRRFTAEETEEWHDADLVIPAFASAVGLPGTAGMTVLMPGEGSLTAIHWAETSPIPARVVTESIPDEATDDARARVRDEMIRALGGSLHIMELTSAPRIAPGGDDDESDFEFIVGEKMSLLAAGEIEAIDVRDKEELLARRRAKARDLLMWRGVLALLALLVLGGLTEAVLVGLKYWQRGRIAKIASQQPAVERVMTNQAVTRRIQQFSESLRPFEMIDAASAKPDSVYFNSTEAREYTLTIKATTRTNSDVAVYEAALRNNPAIAKVELPLQNERDGVTTFTLALTFRPEALNGGPVKP